MKTTNTNSPKTHKGFPNSILEKSANEHNLDDQTLNDFRQHFESIVKNPEMSINELEKELATATKDFLEAINSDCLKYKKEKLDSAQEHLAKIKEIIGFHYLYEDLIKGLQSEVESAKKNM